MDKTEIHPLVLDALHGLKTRVDALEREIQELRQAGPGAAANADMQTFARQLIEQIGKELNSLRPRDDGKTVGAMENGVMHDGEGVYLARYLMPDGLILIWQRDDDTGGFTLKVSDPRGHAVPYEPSTRG